MSLNPNVIICVIAVCAIISPVAVAIVNNHHQRKIRELELAREREKETLSYLKNIYEKYLRAANTVLYDSSYEATRNYHESYAVALAYFPPASHEKLQSIDALIKSHKADEASQELVNFSIWLSSLMKSFL